MSNASWYARKLSEGKAPPPPSISQQMAPSPFRPIAPQPTQPPAPAADRCPNCRSGNYLTTGNPRCFDCGYIAGRDVGNAESGVRVAADGPATPARQVPSSGYQPSNIVGRVT